MKKVVFISSFLLFALQALTTMAQLSQWKLNNNANDAIGTVNGTAVGTPTYSTSSVEGSHTLTLNGTSQYINLGNPSSFPAGSSARTISAWAKPTNTSAGARIIFGYGNTTTGQGMVMFQSGTSLSAGGYGDNLTVTNFWTSGVWHHICFTYDGTTAKLYADGALVSSAAKSWFLILNKAFIGLNLNSTGYWNGSIDDVRIYNTALTAAQVLAIATAPPSVPTGLAVTPVSSSSVNLSWTDASTNETGFQIERSLTLGSGYSPVDTTAANAVTSSDAGLTASTAYYYRIRAINAGGMSSYTSEVSVTTPAAIPAIPSGLTATAASPTSINLSWTDASSNETGFEIERSLTTATGFSLIDTTAANAVSYSDINLTGSTAYYYRIRAINTGGSSAYTTEVTATTPAATPNPPTGLVVTTISPTTINLSWSDASNNETGFHIVRSSQTGTEFSLIATRPPGAVSYSDATLIFGTTYFYKVRAVNASGYSAFTSEASATTTQTILTAPSNLTATAVSATSINLSWTDLSNNETEFKIERALSETGIFSVVATTSPNATANADIGLTAGTTYFYRIRAVSTQGNSVYTSVVSAITPQPLPTAPSGLSAVVVSPTSALLTWRDNASNETEMEIERSLTSGSGYTLLTTVPADTVSFVDSTGLISGNTYYYRVRSVNGGGASVYAVEATVRLPVEGATGTCENIFCGPNGSVGIGTPNVPDGYTLAVNGKIMAEGVKVLLQGDWPDYVFENGYALKGIPDLKKFIDANGHLPNVPSAQTIEKEGIDIGEINVVLLEKIEELSLYLIQMEERMKTLELENEKLKEKNKSKR